jgi:hypothetical protein
MTDKITAWTDPRRHPGAAAHQSVSLTWREDGRVQLAARDVDGQEVILVIPNFVWVRMAQEIGWNAPRHEAELQARRFSLTPELPRPA